LHAVKLGLIHPKTDEFMEWQIELAEDMKVLLEAMRHEDAPMEDDGEGFDFGYQDGDYYEGEADDDFDDFDDEGLDVQELDDQELEED